MREPRYVAARDCGAEPVKRADHNGSTQHTPNNPCAVQQFSCNKFRQSDDLRVGRRRAAAFLPEYAALSDMALAFADAIATCDAASSNTGEANDDVTEVLIVVDGLRAAAHEEEAALHERLIGGPEGIERLCSSSLRKR